MTTEEKYRHILSNHLPPSAVDWVYSYLNLHKVHFHITRGRRTKLGDYRRPFDASPQPGALATGGGSHPFHEISINGDLNPYFFLWVFLHEAAHLETHLKYVAPKQGKVWSLSPHGHEWQAEYARLLAAHAALFPTEIQPLIARYIRRIPLSHPVAKQIEAALQRYDADYDPDTLTLDNLRPGTRFYLKQKPQLRFEALEKRRTRWLCREIPSGRQYLVNGAAQVVVTE